ncbi:hypothetical protein MMC06_001397 [Schaereria dolodes]|nr:hypothetical protein [Schaereria dolodes]
MSFLLMVQQDSEAIADALPKFKGTSHIFIPINDSSNPSSEGGSHWSLLLVSILDGIVYHYDSLNVHNKIQAEHVTQKLSRLLGLPLRGIHLEDNPQQENGMDCGVFVCLQMRYLLLRKLLSAPQHKQVDMNLEGYEVDSALGRKMMLQKIKEFRKEGERRRSYVYF